MKIKADRLLRSKRKRSIAPETIWYLHPEFIVRSRMSIDADGDESFSLYILRHALMRHTDDSGAGKDSYTIKCRLGAKGWEIDLESYGMQDSIEEVPDGQLLNHKKYLPAVGIVAF